jgi:acetoin utilization deacetylase AcuC-like enzyme
MKILFNKKFLLHNADCQAEGAYRIKDFTDINDTNVDGEQWIKLVHPENYRYLIKQACFNNEFIAEVQLSQISYEDACLAVGLTVEASKRGDFAVVRPPGHHAGKETAAGLCLFNNIAIAAQKLVNEGKRVFLLDIDAHHGNGTQDIFYDCKDVLFCSIHQENVYPYTGFVIETGKGKGLGFTYNFPLEAGKGDKDFLDRVEKAIQIAKQFKPDVIGVSAGFDAYENDILMGLKYTKHAYYECAFKLRKAFKKQTIFAVLEGGYHNEIRLLVDAFIEGIENGSKPPRLRFNEDMAIG